MVVSQNKGYVLGGPYGKDHIRIQYIRSILGSPYFWETTISKLEHDMEKKMERDMGYRDELSESGSLIAYPESQQGPCNLPSGLGGAARFVNIKKDPN